MLQAGKSVSRCDGMANANFTRDEVILALDVLYFSGEQHFSGRTPAIQELSALLRKLPIHPAEDQPENFRNPVGVSDQINRFRNIERWGKRFHVGEMFTIVDQEFAERRDELHQIAQSIRRNLQSFDIPFGYRAENNSFPEGMLLGHLHCVIENRDSAKLKPNHRCDICQIDTDDIYPGCSNLMTMHLTVPVTALDGEKRYSATSFITVCPNCHAALHRRRPWLTKENCGDLLR